MIQINTQDFNKAEQNLINILQDYNTQLDTKKGSAIRQLVIRPYAYIYGKINNIISSWIKDTSISTLSKSLQTQNQIADQVASNYFVQRRKGVQAKGYITLHCTQSQIRVSRGMSFIIDGYTFITAKTYIATPTPPSLQYDSSVQYIKMFTVRGEFRAILPVVAQSIEYIQIPEGSQCSSTSYISGLKQVQLTSPITGGTIAQTDASMIQRCRQRCGTSTGTQAAIRLKLSQLSTSVLSASIVGSNSAYSFRSRYNNIGIASGNILDIFVKTHNQTLIKDIVISKQNLIKDGNRYTVILDKSIDKDLTGAIKLVSVNPSIQATINQYSVEYISSSDIVCTEGARLSQYQAIKLDIDIDKVQDIVVSFQYMPGLSDVIQSMKYQDNCIVGTDYLIKSAVPVRLYIQAYIQTTQNIEQQLLQAIKQDISSFINNKQVGQCSINMDDVVQAIRYKYPDVRLKLPYTLSASLPTTNGGTYTFNSTDGILDIDYRDSLYYWATQVYYLSVSPSDITLQVL